MFRWFRQLLRQLFLRGPVLDWWVARRGRQWETAYSRELAQMLGQPAPPVVAPSFTNPGALRQILLIADCMWEQQDLVPELGNIAPTRALDLRPALKSKPSGQTDRATVGQAVRSFMDANAGYSPDVILFYARPLLLSAEVFDLLRQHWKCPLFGMNLDDKAQFFPYGIFSSGDDNYRQWAKNFDLNITNCLPATDWYRRQGLPCVYSPQGVHRTPDLTLPASADFKYNLGFLGSKKPEREVIVNRLKDAGVSINLFGSGWPNAQWVTNPNEIFRSTQINLGIGFATPSQTLTTVKGRDFECPGVGACYLTTYNWELPLHYELGREILCYRSVEELIEIYAYYNQRPEECLKIAQAAWRRCSAEHTWEHRFRKIFQQAGFRLA